MRKYNTRKIQENEITRMLKLLLHIYVCKHSIYSIEENNEHITVRK